MREESDIVWSIIKISLVITGLYSPDQMGTINSCWHHLLFEVTAWKEF